MKTAEEFLNKMKILNQQTIICLDDIGDISCMQMELSELLEQYAKEQAVNFMLDELDLHEINRKHVESTYEQFIKTKKNES